MMNGAGGGGGGERGMKIKYNSSNNCKCPLQLVSLNPGICPICHTHFNSSDKVPLGHSCGHTICKKCSSRIYYEAPNYITNTPLLSYLGLNYQSNFDWLEQDCVTAIYLLGNISLLLKSNPSTSRAMQRKILNLITSLSPNGQNRLIKGAKAVGERSLTEIFALSSHLSHYDAQQQLWCAIRSRACQYMGPAMQEEALKLVLLALEDGSPLSRKVLVMFVVQRLAPQFPQASKTSIGHVIQLLYRASCFDVLKRSEATSLMTLRPEFRSYDSLRTQHDSQIVKIALDSGIRFTPDQWSSILYGDTLHKSHMQSIIDKLQATQSFLQLTNEFFVSLQRSVGQREDSQLLLSLHPHFILLASTEVSEGGMSWSFVCRILEATSCVLSALFSLGNVQNNKLGHGQKGRAFERKKIRSEQGPSYASHEEQFENSCELSEIETKSVRELLNDARAVRKKIKDAQKLLPPIYAKCLEEEANGIEEEAAKMMTQLKLRGVETNQIF